MQIKRYQTRLFILFITVIAISVVGAGLLAANQLRKSHIHALQDGMYRELRLIADTIAWEGNMDEQAEWLGERTGERVTIIGKNGVVVGDSEYAPEQMENHLQRPEIRQVLQSGKAGFAMRHSETSDSPWLYAAVPVYADGELAGFVRLAKTAGDVQAQVRSLWFYLIAGLLFLFASAAVISYRFARRLAAPLQEMIRVSDLLAEANYQARILNIPRDELGRLGQAINRMAENLERQFGKIQAEEKRLKSVLDNMIIGVMMIGADGKITLANPLAAEMVGLSREELIGKPYASVNLQQELAALIRGSMMRQQVIREEIVFRHPKERTVEATVIPIAGTAHEWTGLLVWLHDITELKRLERMRSEFAANVSHELKTPVTAVKGFAETLLNGALADRETAKSFLQIIYEESSRLDRLINDILELSKIESKRLPVQFSPVNLQELVAETLEMMKAEAAKKEIRLTMDVPGELYLEADEDKLRQILINLLSNGINYTPNGGSVHVRAEPVRAGREERMRIVISDTGIGIPAKDLPRIFERFYRVDKARSRASGGTGLGLSIVKHLVDLHKGSVKVESEQGKGSRFTIDLPVLHSDFTLH